MYVYPLEKSTKTATSMTRLLVVVVLIGIPAIAEICATNTLKWRFQVPGADIGATFHVRNPFLVEYLSAIEGTLTWSASKGCHVYNNSAPVTQILCREAGAHTIKLQEWNGLLKETSQQIMVVDDPKCYRWYLVTMETVTSDSIPTESESYSWRLWIIDPAHADDEERNFTAILPSQLSADLTAQFIAKHQDAVISLVPSLVGQEFTIMSMIPHYSLGYWDIRGDLKYKDTYQMRVRIMGKPHVAVGNCFIRDTEVLLSRTKFILGVTHFEDLVQLRGVEGKSVIVQDACATNVAALLTGESVLITQDNFFTTKPLWIQTSVLQEIPSGAVVEAVAFSQFHLFILIGFQVFAKNTTGEEFQKIEGLPASGVEGLTGRQAYLTMCSGQDHPAVLSWNNDTIYGISVRNTFSSVKISKHPLPQSITSRIGFSPGNSSASIQDVVYTLFPSDIGVAVKVWDENQSLFMFLMLNLPSDTWRYLPFFAKSPEIVNLLFVPGVHQNYVFWDSHDIYYSLGSGTNIGVMTVHPCSAHLSSCLESDEIIKQVVLTPAGNIVAITSRNSVLCSSSGLDTFVQLPTREMPTSNVTVYVDMLGDLYFINLGINGEITKRRYSLEEDLKLALFQSPTSCPYKYLSHMETPEMYHVDIGEGFQLWTHLVHPSSQSVSIQVTGSHNRLLQYTVYETSDYKPGWRARNQMIQVSQSALNLQGSNTYEDWLSLNSGLFALELMPSQRSVGCTGPSKKVVNFNVGCPPGRHLKIRIPDADIHNCQPAFNFSIARESVSEKSSEQATAYNTLEYGCPLMTRYWETFRPNVDLYDDDTFIREVTANFVIRELFNRTDYTFNATMQEAGCSKEAQTRRRMMVEFMDSSWGPHNYESCFNGSGNEQGMDLSQPYEIMNNSGVSAVRWPSQKKNNLYMFSLIVVDKEYSFCPLETKFAVLVVGDSRAHVNTSEVRISLGAFAAIFLVIAIISYVYFREKHIVELEERAIVEIEESAEKWRQKKRMSRVKGDVHRISTRTPGQLPKFLLDKMNTADNVISEGNENNADGENN